MNDKHLRTVDEAKAWLDRHGISVSEWARAHNFHPTVVFAVLSGRARGRRGQSHRVAVALQLKEAASSNELSPLADVQMSVNTDSRFSSQSHELKGIAMT